MLLHVSTRSHGGRPGGPGISAFQPGCADACRRELLECAVLMAGRLSCSQVLLDIPDAGAFYVYDGTNVTTEEIRLFLQDYDDERLERRELQEDEEGGDDKPIPENN